MLDSFDVLRATILALVQGLTEFLPISSSAHLILPSALFGWEDQGLAFDVAVHLGTLSAVVLYFYRDLLDIARGCLAHLFRREASAASRLGWQLVAATVPVIIAGFLMKDVVDEYLRQTSVIAVATIVFGVLLFWADRTAGKGSIGAISWKTALIVGLAQVLALIPGTSRSGITMTAGLFCGLDRQSSSRFSFLLSIPVIAGAALLLVLDLLQQDVVNWAELLYGTVLAGITAFICVHFFLRAINAMGFLPFVIYRLVLGITLLVFFT